MAINYFKISFPAHYFRVGTSPGVHIYWLELKLAVGHTRIIIIQIMLLPSIYCMNHFDGAWWGGGICFPRKISASTAWTRSELDWWLFSVSLHLHLLPESVILRTCIRQASNAKFSVESALKYVIHIIQIIESRSSSKLTQYFFKGSFP